jgi:hypothetical protein
LSAQPSPHLPRCKRPDFTEQIIRTGDGELGPVGEPDTVADLRLRAVHPVPERIETEYVRTSLSASPSISGSPKPVSSTHAEKVPCTFRLPPSADERTPSTTMASSKNGENAAGQLKSIGIMGERSPGLS